MIAPAALTSNDHRAVFEQHFIPEITRRSKMHFAHLGREARQEAVQDSLCQAWLNFRSAVARGKKIVVEPAQDQPGSRKARRGCVTPATLALFANKSFDTGRRFSGSSKTDVLADQTRITGRSHVLSMDNLVEVPVGDGSGFVRLSDVLPDRRDDENPYENTRRNMDYPAVLRLEHVSDKARCVFGFLASTLGSGSQNALAAELGVSPPRITQIKGELADSLARHDYRSLARRTGRTYRKCGRPRCRIIPLDPRTGTAAE